MHPDKIKNILALSAEDRYGYFIRNVADFEEVWLIKHNDKFVMLGDKAEQLVIPVWPEKEFAELLLTKEWETYIVEKMDLSDFMIWLDKLNQENINLAGFPKDDLTAVVVNAEEMKNHLIYELQKYE
jgi:hypothetical protein